MVDAESILFSNVMQKQYFQSVVASSVDPVAARGVIAGISSLQLMQF